MAAARRSPLRGSLQEAGDENVELYAESQGRGRPLLLIHGFGAHSYTWHAIAPALARDHRVIQIDLKGAGRSPKPAGDRYSIHDHAELVRRFIAAHDLVDLTLVGHSLGGGVALATSVLLGDERRRLRSLVLIDAVAYPQRLPWFIRALRIPLLGPLALLALPKSLLVQIVLRFAYHDAAKITAADIEAYADPLRSRDARRALVWTAREIVPPDLDALVKKYAAIAQPALILWGDHDRVVPLEVGRKLERAIPAAELVVLSDCGHIPQEEHPDQVIERICSFLGRVAGADSRGPAEDSGV